MSTQPPGRGNRVAERSSHGPESQNVRRGKFNPGQIGGVTVASPEVDNPVNLSLLVVHHFEAETRRHARGELRPERVSGLALYQTNSAVGACVCPPTLAGDRDSRYTEVARIDVAPDTNDGRGYHCVGHVRRDLPIADRVSEREQCRD